MDIILASSHIAEQRILEHLLSELTAQKKVLFLVSGGSNIQAAVRILDGIPEQYSASLAVALVDERYGAVGHGASNWQQLEAAGLNLKQAKAIPCLLKELDIETTRKKYDSAIADALAEYECIIGLLGMGADGHIAGILPHSSAASEQNDQYVTAFQGADYSRITLTFKALSQVTSMYVLTYGAAKLSALQRLRDQELSVSELPAKFLKQHSAVKIYNDQIGEPA
jgi:6-phosphogluconolactonase/glucosamine-6-phosphate isomerase/deaminase